MTSPDQDPGDDDLYRSFIESLCLEGQQYAHEVHDGVIEVVFAYEGDLARATLLVTRRQLRHLILPEDDAAGDSAGADLIPEVGAHLRLQAVTTNVQAVLRALRVDESFVVLFEGRFIGSTRVELPPIPGSPDPFDDIEDGFWSSYPPDDPRFGEPGSILGARPGGETDRLSLITSMSPTLAPGRFVFCAVEPEPDDLQPLVRIHVEGRTTLVVDQQVADEHGWEYAAVRAMVTLPVFAAPNAIDLTAEISSALSERDIPCRVVAGLHLDLLFVPQDRGWDTLQALEDLRDAATDTSLFTSPDPGP